MGIERHRTEKSVAWDLFHAVPDKPPSVSGILLSLLLESRGTAPWVEAIAFEKVSALPSMQFLLTLTATVNYIATMRLFCASLSQSS